MLAAGMLQDPVLKAWLGGVVPAWMLLEQDSFDALRRPPALSGGPLRLASDLTSEEVELCAFANGIATLLRGASQERGLKLTATGNLARSVVAELLDCFAWPGFDKAEALKFHKVVNEPDFAPIFIGRQLIEAMGFVRKYKGHLRATPRGRAVIKDANLAALPAMLFGLVIWQTDFGDVGPSLHGRWPQDHAGVVLWSLSMVAADWQPIERLTRLCTIPNRGVIEASWDSGTAALDVKILRSLLWFGMVERRLERIEGQPFGSRWLYRKTALFDRLLTFSVRTQLDTATWH